MAIKDNLQKIMKLRGVKVAELANKTGIIKQSIYKWLSGEYDPGSENLEKLAEALNVSVKDFYDENLTSVSNLDNEQQNRSVARETFYRDLIEDNEEYSLLPKALLKDYKIVPEKLIERINQTNDELKEALVAKYELIIADQDREIQELRSKLGQTDSA